MHRQSLGSPASKLQAHGVIVAGSREEALGVTAEAQKLIQDQASSSRGFDEEERKLLKPQKTVLKPEKYVHLVPLLTVLCFLILYLSSHDPSQKDLSQINGFSRKSSVIDSTNIDALNRVLEIERGNVLTIRSLRNLQELDRQGSKYRLHRKIADF